MAYNHRVILRRIFATCHKLLLNSIIDNELAKLEGDVLVIGAGKEPYKSLCKSAKSITLTDISQEGADIDLIADVHDLPFKNDAFDVVIAIEVFEHLIDPRQASSEINRVLRKDGIVLVSIPFMFRIHGDPNDYQRFTKSGLVQLFNKYADVLIQEFGNRTHVMLDIFSTIGKPFVIFRILNHLFCNSLFSSCVSKDCPSGYVIWARK